VSFLSRRPLALSIGGMLVLSRTRIGEAIARRIGGDTRNPELQAHLESLEDELASLRAQLAETNERLDFAERLLTPWRGGPAQNLMSGVSASIAGPRPLRRW
jgi:hypothetical protein